MYRFPKFDRLLVKYVGWIHEVSKILHPKPIKMTAKLFLAYKPKRMYKLGEKITATEWRENGNPFGEVTGPT